MSKNQRLKLLRGSRAKTTHATDKSVMGHREIMALVEDDLKLVEASILKNFQSKVTLIPAISNYLTNGGGKRLRPILVLLTSKLFGYSGGDDHILHSTVMEYIHAATLLHDDVVDSADIRRGLISANVKWGNGHSVLVGDYLFAKSVSLMAHRSSTEIIQTVSEATKYLAEGEIMQLINSCDPEVTEEEYLDLVYRKTGALITACCRVGAFLGDSSLEQRKAIEVYGKNAGIAFQLTDDMLDFISDEKTLGKPVGNDLAEGHITLPFIQAFKNADQADRKFMQEAVKDRNLTPRNIQKIISLIEKYDGIGYTARLARTHVDRAIDALGSLEPNIHRDALEGLADYITNRTT